MTSPGGGAGTAVRPLDVAGHLLDVAPSCGGTCVRWELRCAGCLALVAGETARLSGDRLVVALFLPALARRPGVTLALGPLDGAEAKDVQAVATSPWRRPSAMTVHRVEGLPVWAATCPGRARTVVTVQGRTPLVSAVRRQPRQRCPGPADT